MTECKKCRREWPEDSEQAAAARIYNHCIVCCVEMERTENYSWSIDDVVENRRHFISSR